MSGLPQGWTWATLAEVTQNVSNVYPEQTPTKDFGYVDISAINNNTYSISVVRTMTGKDAPSRAKRPVQVNDVLFSNVRTYLRNIALIPPNSGAQVCSTGFTVLRPNEAIDPHFLFRWVLTDTFIERVTPKQTGTHYPATSDRVVRSERIPLPPLNEQRRIVAKLERLLSRVSTAQERLATIPRILKRFRQSILSAACSGSLTRDWRKVHPEVERRFEDAFSNGRIAEVRGTEEQLGYEIPQSWFSAPLDLLCSKITDGEHITPPLTEHGIPLLSAKDVRDNALDFKETKFVSEETAIRSRSRCDPELGDLLVVSRGATVGRSCRVAVNETFCLMGSVLLFKPKSDLVLPHMLEYSFKNPDGLSSLVARSGATAQQAIYIRDMRSFPVPVPPISEQHEIIRRAEALFKTADALEGRYMKAKAHVDNLMQSILAKAFRGDLVPQDPNDEPASVLLKRITGEPIGSAVVKRRSRK